MTIRGILFDAAGVFYRRPRPTYEYVASLVEGMGLSLDLSAKGWSRQKALRSRANKGHLSPDEYWGQVLLMAGVVDTLKRRVLVTQINSYSDNVLPIPGGSEALAGLKQRGFLLGIVTDTMYPLARKKRWLDQVGVAEFIDVIACSTVVGAHKPEPEMYLNALQQASLTPAESAFVGHDAEELDGARKAGMATVAVNHDPGTKADYYARSLVDLLNVPIFETAHT
ncbi:MAG: HAD-IA family hydrolase [Anaerolineales bacterium]|nr:MAG: HAD-IA family hydrolase [Anaerolineales bacterium]